MTAPRPEETQEQAIQVHREEQRKFTAGLPAITMAAGREALAQALEMADPQQREFIRAVGRAGSEGYEAIQGAACAGAGKTFSVVCGIANAIHERRVQTDQVLLTTFTRKAAREMIHRMCLYLPKSMVSTMAIGTFHSLAFRLGQNFRIPMPKVKEHAPKTWIRDYLSDRTEEDGKPLVLCPGVTAQSYFQDASLEWARVEIYRLITNVFEPWGIYSWAEYLEYRKTHPNRPSASDLELPRWTKLTEAANDLEKSLSTKIKAGKGKIGMLAGHKGANLNDYVPGTLVFQRTWDAVAAMKKHTSTGTFGDVLQVLHKNAHRLKQYKLVIVDEAQDNSWVQNQIAFAAAEAGGATLLMTGDSRQSMYGFRGAAPSTVASILARGGKRQEISTNYRSGRWIVEAGNLICLDSTQKPYPWAGGEAARAGRKNPDGTEFLGKVVFVTPPKPLTPGERLLGGPRQVVQTIQAEIEAGRSPSDYAILARTNDGLGAFEFALSLAGIPCKYAASNRTFLDSLPVRKMVGLLALGAGLPASGEAAAELAQDVFRGDHGWAAGRFRRYPRREWVTRFARGWNASRILGALREVGQFNRYKKDKPPWQEDAEDLRDEFKTLQKLGWPAAAREAASLLDGWAGTEAAQEDGPDSPDDPSDPEAPDLGNPGSYYALLTEMAQQFPSYTEFVQRLIKLAAAPDETTGSVGGAAVTLSTAHRAKGLEWPIVYVFAPGEVWPSARASAGEPEEEELRVYYVAVTRGRDETRICDLGDGRPSKFTTHLAQRLTPLMKAAEAEQANRTQNAVLREAGVEILQGPSGWQVYQHAAPLALPPHPTWAEARMSYLTHLETASPALSPFLAWLRSASPDTYSVVGAVAGKPGADSVLRAITQDKAVTARLGWQSLSDLQQGQRGTLIFSEGNRVLGYLTGSAEGPTYHGYLDVALPVAHCAPTTATPPTNLPALPEGSLALALARLTLAETLQGGGRLPMTAESASTTVVAPPPVYTRELLTVALPKTRENFTISALVLSPQGAVLATVYLDPFREVQLFTNALVYVTEGPATLYRVSRTGDGVGKLVPVGVYPKLRGAPLQELAPALYDLPAQTFAEACPGAQAVWEVGYGKVLGLDFNRIVFFGTHIPLYASYAGEGVYAMVQRLISAGYLQQTEGKLEWR